MKRLTPDRTETGAGPRVREFARIAREAGTPQSDPKVRAMTRRLAGTAGARPVPRYLRMERRLGS